LQFCQANDVFTIELARRLNAAESHVTITNLKIGVVKTNIRNEFSRWMKWLLPILFDPLLGQTPQQAAEAALELLTAEEYEGVTGTLFTKIRKFKKVNSTRSALDPEEGSRLWNLSENLATEKAAIA